MTMEEIAIKLQEVVDKTLRNEGRIEKIEKEHETLHQLATSVAIMAEQMKTMNKSVNTLTAKVGELEGKPAKRWESVVEKILLVIVGAAATYVATQIGF